MEIREIIIKIVKYCEDNNKNAVEILGNYFASLEPIYLPPEIRYLANHIDRHEIYDYLAKELVDYLNIIEKTQKDV